MELRGTNCAFLTPVKTPAKRLPLFLLVGLLAATAGQAAVITFNSLPFGGNNFLNNPTVVDGFSFTSSHFHVIDNPGAVSVHSNGTTYLGGELGATLVMTQVGGGGFSLNSFDATQLWGAGGDTSNATSVNLTGAFIGGGTISSSFVLGAGFSAYSVVGFNNLASVVFSPVGGDSFGVDNIGVNNSVPDSGATLSLLAFVGAAFVALRRKIAR